ncbi:MAG: hypothetical protein ACFBZ8_11965 [Opitutales bacterium]
MPSFRQFLDGLRTSAPEPIRWIPGAVFFCHLEELAPGLPADEVASLAELTVEELSPFPIEQLAWGYLHNAEKSRLFLFAAFRESLRQEGESPDAWVRDTFVFPDFLPALVRDTTGPAQARFFLTDSSLTAALHRAGEVYPDTVLSEPLEVPQIPDEGEDDPAETVEITPDAPSPQAIEAAQARLFGQFDRRTYPPSGDILTLAKVELRKKEAGVALHISRHDDIKSSIGDTAEPASDAEIVTLPDETALWQADIRQSDFKRRERAQRKLAGKLWVATQVAAALALLLLVLEGALGVFGIFATEQTVAQAEMQTEVDVLLQRKDNLALMQQFSGREFEPFQFLRVLQRPMPNDFYFRNAFVTRPDKARIQARFNEGSGSIALVNQYIERLEATGLLEKVQFDSKVSGPQVFLDLTAEFKSAEEFPDQLSFQAPQPNTNAGDNASENATTALLERLRRETAPVN